MVELTVAHVAGLVAAGFFLAHRLCPDGLTLILSRLLHDRSSAATLTVASAALQKSLWPILLQTDVAYSHAVDKPILFISRLLTVASILVGIAAVVTPLGLYTVLLPGDETVATFAPLNQQGYANDPSPFGYGTSPRSNLSWARQCNGLRGNEPSPCPFSNTVSVVSTFPNGTVNYDYPYGYNMSVPDVLLQTYSSGTKAEDTVSNYFDIQYRRTSTKQDLFRNNGTDYLVSANRNLESLVENNAGLAVEGLVVDAMTGGIGFRNHTVPVGFPHGIRWTEDLLFVEPETACVDTNLTLDYTISNTNRSTTNGIFLTDRGGFVNLNRTYPLIDTSDPQANPNLLNRAYKAAWLHNAYTAVYLNVSNPTNGTQKAFAYMKSELDKQFRFSNPAFDQGGISGLDTLEMTSSFGGYVKPATDEADPSIGTNPFGIGLSNWSSINIACSGTGNGDFANISNILVSCGQVRGVPQRLDNMGSSLVYERGSVWSQKIFACATAVKATVKTVSFEYNRTDHSLEGLVVAEIRAKTYSDNASLPLWGVEDTGNAWRTSDLNLIWGIVDDSYANNLNVSTVRQPSLHLPGFLAPGNEEGGSYGNERNFPGSDFSVAALSSVYSVGSTMACSTARSGLSMINSGVDYTGRTSFAMWARWQTLTSRADLASLIPSLVFTDVAASMVVGTKGTLGPGNTGGTSAAITGRPMVSKVRYRMQYGIPAFLVAALLIFLVIGVVLVLILPADGHGGLGRLRYHIQGLSSGRVYTMLEQPDAVSSAMKAKEWSKQFGSTEISLLGSPEKEGQLLAQVEEVRPNK